MRQGLRTLMVALGATAVLVTAGCGGGGGNPLTAGSTAAGGTVTVGSANFPENVLLAEIYAQALEAKGVKVSRKFNIGSREVIYSQIQSGALAILPEYNGALLSYLKKDSTAITMADVNQQLTAALPSTLKLLDSAPAEDKDAIVVTSQTAQSRNLKSIADLVSVAPSLVLGGPPEFKTRQQGVVGLKSVYGVQFKDFKALDVAGPITISALKQGDVQAANLFSTDPAVVSNNFVVLEDPKQLFGAQNVTPLVNASALNDQIKAALNGVSAKLDTPSLATMVKKVVADKDDADKVAKAWLTSAGLG